MRNVHVLYNGEKCFGERVEIVFAERGMVGVTVQNPVNLKDLEITPDDQERLQRKINDLSRACQELRGEIDQLRWMLLQAGHVLVDEESDTNRHLAGAGEESQVVDFGNYPSGIGKRKGS